MAILEKFILPKMLLVCILKCSPLLSFLFPFLFLFPFDAGWSACVELDGVQGPFTEPCLFHDVTTNQSTLNRNGQIYSVQCPFLKENTK